MNRKPKKFKWWLAALISLTIIFTVSFIEKQTETILDDNSLIAQIVEEEEVKVIEYDIYGIELEKYVVQKGVVRNSQTLSHILGQFDLGNVMVDKIVSETIKIFDPRRIRTGNSFHVYNGPDSLDGLKYFVYDISALEYIIVDLSDSLFVKRGAKEVNKITKTASGVINGSLWVTLTRNNLNPELAIRMSEIMAWEVDFYRIQSGDRFKVVYEENYVGEESIGIGRIEAIYFRNHGRDIYGFKFEHEDADGYFGPKGQNLRKVFLKAPIKFGRISSGFSHNRLHPVLGVRRPHYGTDYAAPTGTPIYAVGDGVITEAKFTSANGNYVRMRHNSVYETQYLHMSRFAAGMKPGKRVKQGDVIGYVGMTGLATGPHVCFRFWKNGQQVNHLNEQFPSADPLDENYMEVFAPVRDHWMQVLENIDFADDLPV
jgi:murein DD-endopeptidase MepM/ murein hydrolase activator NlpD